MDISDEMDDMEFYAQSFYNRFFSKCDQPDRYALCIVLASMLRLTAAVEELTEEIHGEEYEPEIAWPEPEE